MWSEHADAEVRPKYACVPFDPKREGVFSPVVPPFFECWGASFLCQVPWLEQIK